MAVGDDVAKFPDEWDYGVSALNRNVRLAEVLAAGLRAQVMSLDEDGRDRVFTTEAEVIKQSGLSRGTVREALRLLESEGTITRKRGVNGGIVGNLPDRQSAQRSLVLLVAAQGITVDQFLSFRLAVEPYAAGRAAADATDEERAQLRELAAADNASPRGAAALHRAIIVAAHIDVLDLMWDSFSTLTELETGIEPLSTKDTSAQAHVHELIVDAIVAGDSQKAESLMRKHLEAIRDTLGDKARLEEPLIPRSFWTTPEANRLFIDLDPS
jgi:GntR family transcriptional regulator, transcriptional repressor for pyruvate dehydrogenase complex